MGDLTEHFSEHEFYCHHCGKLFETGVDDKLLLYLEAIREHFDAPVTIVSGYRCPVHNASLPNAAPSSQHLLGTAADISVKGVTPKEVLKYAKKLLPNTGGLGIYPDWVHIDSRRNKARW